MGKKKKGKKPNTAGGDAKTTALPAAKTDTQASQGHAAVKNVSQTGGANLRQRPTANRNDGAGQPRRVQGDGQHASGMTAPNLQRRASAASYFSFTFLRYADAFHFEGLATVLIVLGAFLVRYAVSMHPHSGQGKPPMYGDYEAQRHWMEITVNLPPSEWYYNTSRNDLQYWGLDYPPLSAYLAYGFGKLAQQPAIMGNHSESFVALYTSRGDESGEGKLFMRGSTLVTDFLIFIPAVIAFFQHYYRAMPWATRLTGACLVLMQPAFILIDHGHFQYNNVALGLVVWSLYAILTRHDLIAAALYILALNFKHMTLYYAPAYFAFYIGRALRRPPVTGLFLVIKLGVVVIATTSLCWYPVVQSYDDAAQLLHRLFPWDRGLYEDKVANFWCSISPLWNARNILPAATLKQMTLATTLAGLVPVLFGLARRPTFFRLLQAMVASSLAFFFFSYQVHEKAILLTVLPLSLAVLHFPGSTTWACIVATFSLYPLMIKDELRLAFAAVTAVYIVLVVPRVNLQWWARLSLAGCAILYTAIHVVTPPARLPDLGSLAFAAYSFANLVLVYQSCARALLSSPPASAPKTSTGKKND